MRSAEYIEEACEVMHDALRPPGLTGIPLRNRAKELVGIAVVDTADVPLLGTGRWYLNNGGYAADVNGYMHRRILGDEATSHTDHRNGDRSDNRRINLRSTDSAGNARNVVVRNVRQLDSGRHQAFVWDGEKQLALGTYGTPEEAAQVAKNWKLQHWQDYIDRETEDCVPMINRMALVHWAEVPEPNKQTMRAAVIALLKWQEAEHADLG